MMFDPKRRKHFNETGAYFFAKSVLFSVSMSWLIDFISATKTKRRVSLIFVLSTRPSRITYLYKVPNPRPYQALTLAHPKRGPTKVLESTPDHDEV